MAYEVMDLVPVSKIIVEKCAAVAPDEDVLLLTDTTTHPSVLDAMIASIRNVGARVTVVARTFPRRPHDLPPAPVSWAMKGATMIFDLSRYDILHTLPIREALFDYGARYIGVANQTPQTFLAPNLADVDYDKTYADACRLIEVLERGSTLRYTSPNGTDLKADIRGRKWYPLAGVAREPGRVAMIPIGEVFGLGVHGGTSGTVVLESLQAFGRLSTPIVLQVEGSWVTKVEGGEEAERLRTMWAQVENANYIGELGGIGLNPKAKVSGRLDANEESMMLGAVHIGFGDSLTYGGRVSSRMHLNGVITNVTVEVDGRPVVADGQIRV